MQWFNAGSILGSLSVAMLHLPGKSYIGGLLFLPVAVAIMLYALSMYQLRLRLLRRRRMEGYHDAWGPTLLTVSLRGFSCAYHLLPPVAAAGHRHRDLHCLQPRLPPLPSGRLRLIPAAASSLVVVITVHAMYSV